MTEIKLILTKDEATLLVMVIEDALREAKRYNFTGRIEHLTMLDNMVSDAVKPLFK